MALATIVLSAALALRREFSFQRAQAQAGLESVAELRKTQVESWIERQMTLATFIAHSPFFAEQFKRWRDDGDGEAGHRMLDRLIQFRKANGAGSVLVIDAAGVVLAREHPANRAASDEVRIALGEAIASGAPVHTDIYRLDDDAVPLRLDVVVPLLLTGSPAKGAIVIRIDPRQTLFPLLRAWPVPSPSGESLLWSNARGLVATPDRTVVPATEIKPQEVPWSPSNVRVIDAIATADATAEAKDYRGNRVLATSRSIRDTNWNLISKIDLREVDEDFRVTAIWIVTTAGLAIASILAVGWLWVKMADRGARLEGANTVLADQQALLRSIADAIPGMVGYWGADLRCRFANIAYLDWFGKNPEQMAGIHMR